MSRKLLLILIFMLFSAALFAGNQPRIPLPADKAFVLTLSLDSPRELIAAWRIAPGYYLYKDRIEISLQPSNQEKITEIRWPVAKVKSDEVRGKFQIYTGNLKIPVILQGISYNDDLHFQVKYQGCSSDGFCYPPTTKDITLTVSTNGYQHPLWQDQQGVKTFLQSHHLLFNLLVFMGLGLMLAFTPCVLPMVPILSAIIIGHGHKLSNKHAFILSVTYVTGMALTYALAGLAAAWLGSSVQPIFQKPWVIVTFSGIFVVLALSFFSLYEFRLPRAWQKSLNTINHRLHGGTYFGAFTMGAFSTLIVSPCVSAPLVGVLAYISQTGDKVLGGLALLSLGIGMGIPLILVGMSARKWLPKVGPWMEVVKKAWGVLMLGVAIWLLSRVVSAKVTMCLWSLLLTGTAIYAFIYFPNSLPLRRTNKLLISLIGFYGVLMIAGTLHGSVNPQYPWRHWQKLTSQSPSQNFIVVHDLQQVQHEIALAKQAGKPLLLDFYADWCDSCVIMEKRVFRRPEVEKNLANFVLLRADITNNTAADAELMKHYQVIAPPTILIFNNNGRELSTQRVVGEVNAKEFLKRLTQARMS